MQPFPGVKAGRMTEDHQWHETSTMRIEMRKNKIYRIYNNVYIYIYKYNYIYGIWVGGKKQKKHVRASH